MDQANLTKRTIHRIRDMITTSGLRPGDKFATEGELQKSLKVSRSLLREAVSALKTLGYLTSKQYVGLTAATPDPIALFEEALSTWAMDRTDIQELSELRYAIETGSAELAAMRVTGRQVAELHALIAELSKSVASDAAGRPQDDIDLDIHRKILEATHNAKIEGMCRVLAAFFDRAPKERSDWVAHRTEESLVSEHRSIVGALEARDVEKLRALLSGHLSCLLPPYPRR